MYTVSIFIHSRCTTYFIRLFGNYETKSYVLDETKNISCPQITIYTRESVRERL